MHALQLRLVSLWGLVSSGRLILRLRQDRGFSTAELLGNAALGILALLAIWTVLSDQGSQLVADLLDRISSP